jgi:hypothetical protein
MKYIATVSFQISVKASSSEMAREIILQEPIVQELEILMEKQKEENAIALKGEILVGEPVAAYGIGMSAPEGTEDGLVICGECGKELECDAAGDMPDICPGCGKRLEWSEWVESYGKAEE